MSGRGVKNAGRGSFHAASGRGTKSFKSDGERTGKVKQTGAVPELDVFDYSVSRIDARSFNDAKRKLLDYASIHYDRAAHIIEFGEEYDFSFQQPELPDFDEYGASETEKKIAMERHLKAWVEYDKRVEQYMQNRMRLYGVLWGQCTTAMRHKLMEDEEYNVWSRSKNTLKLWVTIKTLSLEDRGPSNQNAFKRADDAMVAFQKIRQYASEKIGDFYDRFLTEVDAAELCGVDFRNPAQAEQICEKLRKLLLVRKKKEQQHRMQAHAQVLQQQAAAAAAARRAQEEAREQESEEAQAKPLGRHRAKMTMPVRDAGEMEETSYSSRSEPARASVHQVPPSVQQVPLNLPDPVITTDEESEIKEEALLKSRDQQLAMIFLNKLDTKRYGSMLAEWENRLNDGDDVYPL